ncbi:hypothetical protein ACFQX6_16995 [Streptosporangium lutulentum]
MNHQSAGKAPPKIDLTSFGAFAAGSQLFATGAAELSFHLASDWARSVLGEG